MQFAYSSNESSVRAVVTAAIVGDEVAGFQRQISPYPGCARRRCGGGLQRGTAARRLAGRRRARDPAGGARLVAPLAAAALERGPSGPARWGSAR